MHQVTNTFVERLGLISESYGVPRIAGNMVGLFLMDAKRRSLDEIAELLQVSKGSASTNARLLESMGVLERRSVAGDRRDYYQLADFSWEKMFENSRLRIQEVGRVLQTQLDSLPPELEGARTRLQAWVDFHHYLLQDLDERTLRWREHMMTHCRNGSTHSDQHT